MAEHAGPGSGQAGPRGSTKNEGCKELFTKGRAEGRSCRWGWKAELRHSSRVRAWGWIPEEVRGEEPLQVGGSQETQHGNRFDGDKRLCTLPNALDARGKWIQRVDYSSTKVIFSKRLIYSFENQMNRMGERSSIFWFAHKMAAIARAGSDQSQEP